MGQVLKEVATCQAHPENRGKAASAGQVDALDSPRAACPPTCLPATLAVSFPKVGVVQRAGQLSWVCQSGMQGMLCGLPSSVTVQQPLAFPQPSDLP